MLSPRALIPWKALFALNGSDKAVNDDSGDSCDGWGTDDSGGDDDDDGGR